ncbi:PepSY domain-containing protein [Novosphingobium sp.]|uniref:PepSY domain-containing protein n=1 Tax=Novosphingobium sp. TaxID=1874826 RepID=UPI002735EB2D|nr:PepSY domain-containing protein [Novosphingobium sp.]MDP3907213.1 PepSY domain-containing protein [Novosphingobium sp.]
MRKLTFLIALAIAVPAMPVLAQPGGEQKQVRKEARAGNVLPLRQLEQKVLPAMAGAQYLGPEYDPTVMVYRMKFIRDGRVIFVDIDARSGDILRQSR